MICSFFKLLINCWLLLHPIRRDPHIAAPRIWKLTGTTLKSLSYSDVLYSAVVVVSIALYIRLVPRRAARIEILNNYISALRFSFAFSFQIHLLLWLLVNYLLLQLYIYIHQLIKDVVMLCLKLNMVLQ